MLAKIKKIENHYKRQLFIRKPKGVELTESGMNLYQQYKKMIFTWEETENKCKTKHHNMLVINGLCNVSRMLVHHVKRIRSTVIDQL